MRSAPESSLRRTLLHRFPQAPSDTGLPSLTEQVIANHEGGHRLNHGHSAWEDAGIVATTTFKFGVLSMDIDGRLRLHDRCRWFEGNAENDVFGIADSTLNSTGPIARRFHRTIFHSEMVVVLHAGE